MGATKQISTIQLHNRPDACASRLFAGDLCDWETSSSTYNGASEGAVIGVSDSSCDSSGCTSGTRTICTTIRSPESDHIYDIDCNGASGQYAYIMVPGNNRMLNIMEFDINQIATDELDANAPLCSDGTVSAGDTATCTASLARPIDVHWEMKSTSYDECLSATFFAMDDGKNSGVSYELGGWTNKARFFPDDWREVTGSVTDWRKCRLSISGSGVVKFWLDDSLLYTTSTTLTSGTMRFHGGCIPMAYRNVYTTKMPTTSETSYPTTYPTTAYPTTYPTTSYPTPYPIPAAASSTLVISATASTTYLQSYASQAIDGDTSTRWNYWHSTEGVPQWLELALGSSQAVCSYAFMSRNDVYGGYDSPTAWHFQVWGGSSWTTVSTETGQRPWGRAETKVFSNPRTEGSKFRLYVTEVGGRPNGAADCVVIKEIWMYECPNKKTDAPVDGKKIVRCAGLDSGCTDIGENDGDCDRDSDCHGDLVCGIDNCEQGGDMIFDSTDDCCKSPHNEAIVLLEVGEIVGIAVCVVLIVILLVTYVFKRKRHASKSTPGAVNANAKPVSESAVRLSAEATRV
jgi:hypothetical protein